VILRFLLLLALVPLIELGLLVWLADMTNWRVPFAWVIISGCIGTWLIRTHGLRRRGASPSTRSPIFGLTALAAGVLLLIPGILTDLLAVLFLIPATRRVMLAILALKLQKNLAAWPGAASYANFSESTTRRNTAGADRVIDVKVLERPASADD
jgi:UPF0716 protein FxsA